MMIRRVPSSSLKRASSEKGCTSSSKSISETSWRKWIPQSSHYCNSSASSFHCVSSITTATTQRVLIGTATLRDTSYYQKQINSKNSFLDLFLTSSSSSSI